MASNQREGENVRSRMLSEADKYMRVRSAPPQEQQEEEKVETPFLLCNADGTPLTVESAESESAEEESVSQQPVDSAEKSTDPDDFFVDLEESEESDFPGEFERFMLVEELMSLYPPTDESTVRACIAQILAVQERTAIPFDLIPKRKEGAALMNEKLRALKEKKDTALERVRNELNRVTDSNLAEVIDNLLAIRVERVDDMKEISAFVFEKAINEQLFLKLYATIIGRLKKVWKTTEELAMTDKSQTCFYGTLVKYLIQKITARHGWSSQVDISKLQASSRAELEQQIEDLEAERLFKKKQAMGAINFLVMLYDINVIGPTNITTVVNSLIGSAPSPEHVEMLCAIVKSSGNKLVMNNKEDLVNKILQYLRQNDKRHGGRIDYLIERTAKEAARYMNGAKAQNNTFAGLVHEEEERKPVRDEDEIATEYVLGLAKRLGGDEDTDGIVKGVDDFLAEHSSERFFTAFFVETVSNHRIGGNLQSLFLHHLSSRPADLPGSLRALKDQLGMLSIDFPISTTRYSELLVHLRGANLISSDLFESLKTNEFSKKIEPLQRRWRETGDHRFDAAFSSN